MFTDEEFMRECLAMFERRAVLERSTDGGRSWQTASGEYQIQAFRDKGNAHALGSPSGLKFSDGSVVRFREA